LHMGRQERFGYVCRRCLRCCHHKWIQLNPYEVARLARNRGQTTTQFRKAWTVGGAGIYLRQTEDGACVFLGADGCTVHPDRPLVCRLYPLGRHVSLDGEERFSHAKPHPLSEGVFTDEGTIGDFLEEQGAAPFIQAADDYLRWFGSAFSALSGDLGYAPGEIVGAPTAESDDLLDMDAAIAEHCAVVGRAEPDDIENRKQLHLAILFERLSSAKGG
jgi:Fe-S-cluster containining protein